MGGTYLRVKTSPANITFDTSHVPFSRWTKESDTRYSCFITGDNQTLVDTCLTYLKNLVAFGTIPILPPTPMWGLQFQKNTLLGVTTNITQKDMQTYTKNKDDVPNLFCNGNTGFHFTLSANLNNNSGYEPTITEALKIPCENGETSFGCETLLKTNEILLKTDKSIFVPITMLGVKECSGTQSTNCTVQIENKLIYYCPAT